MHGWTAGTWRDSTRRPDKVQRVAGIGLSRVIEKAESAPMRPNSPTSSRRLHTTYKTCLSFLFFSEKCGNVTVYFHVVSLFYFVSVLTTFWRAANHVQQVHA